MNGLASLRKGARRPAALLGGDRIFQRIFTRLGCQGRPPQFQVELYPYANLSHTLRLRQDVALVRLSDILREAPVPVIEAAAAILLGQMYRRRVPGELRDVYRRFALAHTTRRHIARVRRKRARRIADHPQGTAHDLDPMFAALNDRYFEGRLRRPRLGWSARPWRSQFGCYDPSLDQIVMNKRLDRAEGTMSASASASRDLRTPRHSVRRAACEFRRCRPIATGMPPMETVSLTRSRVVPGVAVTMARSRSTRRLNRLDLPTLGRPTMASVRPSCTTLPYAKVAAVAPAARGRPRCARGSADRE